MSSILSLAHALGFFPQVTPEHRLRYSYLDFVCLATRDLTLRHHPPHHILSSCQHSPGLKTCHYTKNALRRPLL